MIDPEYSRDGSQWWIVVVVDQKVGPIHWNGARHARGRIHSHFFIDNFFLVRYNYHNSINKLPQHWWELVAVAVAVATGGTQSTGGHSSGAIAASNGDVPCVDCFL